MLDRGLWPESLVAGLAVLAAAWPLTELIGGNEWVGWSVLAVLLIGLVGSSARALGAGPNSTVVAQAVAGVGYLIWLFLRDTLWYVVPTGESLRRTGELLVEASTVLQTYAPPAPASEGVQFLLVSVLTLTALSVDSIAVTARAPATAGIPLAAAFLVSVSNSGKPMAPWYFIALAAAWLLMMAQQGDRMLSGWSSRERREWTSARDVDHGPTGHRSPARVIAGLTVLGALVVASMLPHLPPLYLAEGMARNPDARSVSGDTGQVSFTETMDLTRDLNSDSTVPVITYRTTGPPTEPLRVTSTRVFDDGRWRPPDYDSIGARSSGGILNVPIAGLSPELEVQGFEFTVDTNGLDAPHLASPGLLQAVDLPVPAAWDATTGAVRTDGQAEGYTTSSLYLRPGQDLSGYGEGDPEAFAEQFDDELLRVDEPSQEAVAALAEEVVGDATNDLEAAARIQAHLRGARYTYSLTLAENPAGVDPVTHFLQSRQGYCVQFATAMVMMARHEGIPARMAVGFLPGEVQPGGTYQVLASDAHTWPELWIEGMGWTRFEPTQGVGSPAPSWSLGETPVPEPTQTAAPPVPEPVEPTGTPEDEPWWGFLGDLAPILGRLLLGLLLLSLLLAVVPWAGRRYREAGLRDARTPSEQVEGQWQLLTRWLEDYGVDTPGPRSPRQMAHHYDESAKLDRRSGEALHRATATLERARYAPESSTDAESADAMGRDVRTVVEAVRDRLPWNLRANAALLPKSGFTQLRRVLRRR